MKHVTSRSAYMATCSTRIPAAAVHAGCAGCQYSGAPDHTRRAATAYCCCNSHAHMTDRARVLLFAIPHCEPLVSHDPCVRIQCLVRSKCSQPRAALPVQAFARPSALDVTPNVITHTRSLVLVSTVPPPQITPWRPYPRTLAPALRHAAFANRNTSTISRCCSLPLPG